MKFFAALHPGKVLSAADQDYWSRGQRKSAVIHSDCARHMHVLQNCPVFQKPLIMHCSFYHNRPLFFVKMPHDIAVILYDALSYIAREYFCPQFIFWYLIIQRVFKCPIVCRQTNKSISFNRMVTNKGLSVLLSGHLSSFLSTFPYTCLKNASNHYYHCFTLRV